MRAPIALLIAAAASLSGCGGGCGGGALTGGGGVSGVLTGAAGVRGVGGAAGGVGGAGGIGGVAGGIGGFIDAGAGGAPYDCSVPPADGGASNEDGGTPPTGPALGLLAPLSYSNVPFSSALADVTGDGKDDLVSVGSSVTVRFNDGSGRLGAPIDVAPGAGMDDSAYPIVMGDLNGDGNADLAYVHGPAFPKIFVAVLLGDGAGGFGPAADYRVGSGSASLAIGDLDGDGDSDLVLYSREFDHPGELDVLTNAGDGSFPSAVRYAAPPINGPVAVADLDGDGRDDVVVGGSPSESVVVYANRGNGQLLAPVSVPAGSNVVNFAIGDVDGDGKPDLVVVNQLFAVGSFGLLGGMPSAVGVLRNRGNFAFAVPVPYAVGIEAWAGVLADLNGDGKLDVAVTNINTTDASVLYNKGDGSFAGEVRLGVGGTPSDILVGEMNGDGRSDLAFINVSWDLVVALSGKQGALGAGIDYPTGPLPPYPEYAPTFPAAIASGDLDGDGKPDLVVSGTIPPYEGMKLLLNQGGGTFGPPVALYANYSTSPGTLAIADLNGDGRPDLVSGDGGPCLAFNSGGDLNGDTCYSDVLVVDGNRTFVVGDVNNDRKADLVVVGGNATQTLLNPGNGRFDGVSPQTSSGAGTVPSSAVLADLNEDGRLDLIYARLSIGPTYPGGVAVAFGAGNGRFGDPVFLDEAGSSPVSVAVADLNGDRHLDIAVGNSVETTCIGSRGTLDVLLGDGTGGFRGPAHHGGGGYGTIAATDIDGDGDVDLIALDAVPYSGSFTETSRVNVFVNEGGAYFGAPLRYATARDPTSMTVGDLNGDGRPDIAVATSRGAVTVLLNGPR